jgi:uncharacterized protein YacL
VANGNKRAPFTRKATAVLVQLTRVVMATLGALAGLSVQGLIDWNQQIGYPVYTIIILFVILGTSVGFILGGMIGRELQRGYEFLEAYVRDMWLSDLILGVAGLLVGLVLALILSVPVRSLQPPVLGLVGQVAMFVLLGYLGMRVAFVKRGDVKDAFTRMAPAQNVPGLPQGGRVRLLDTSAIIDGRFAKLMESGFIDGDVRVPGFVLSEMQTLADSADDARRARGRRGLDLLATLRGGDQPVEVFAADYPELPDVDSKLVQLATDLHASIVTVDYNLTQVARFQDIRVLNVNDLATALKPAHLPGEQLRVQVTKEGKEPEQGVGYLEDGTMVVIQNGRSLLGSAADVFVTSVLQTAGGRMVFARPGATE